MRSRKINWPRSCAIELSADELRLLLSRRIETEKHLFGEEMTPEGSHPSTLTAKIRHLFQMQACHSSKARNPETGRLRQGRDTLVSLSRCPRFAVTSSALGVDSANPGSQPSGINDFAPSPSIVVRQGP